MNAKNLQTLRDLVAQHQTIRFGILPRHAQQTDEAHTIRMLALAPLVARTVGLKLDPLHLQAVILAHDLPEFGLKQDVTSYEQEYIAGQKTAKEDYERKTRAALTKKHGAWLGKLIDEYENQTSESARFVKWLDKYEANRHMLEIMVYGTTGHQPGDDHVHLFITGKRLVKAALALPIMQQLTLEHLKEEIQPYFKRDGRKDEYQELITMLGQPD